GRSSYASCSSESGPWNPSNCRDSCGGSGRFCGAVHYKRVIQQADNPGNDGYIREVKNVPVKAPVGRGNVEKDEIGDPPVGQAVDGVAESTSDDQAKGERGEPVMHTRKPKHEQQDSNRFEAQQYPLAERSLRLKKSVADARIAGEDDVDEGAEPDRSVGGEIKNEQQVDLGTLVERADDCSDGQSETRQWSAKIGTGDQYLLRRSARCFPFAQRLRVTRRHVRIFGVGADRGEDFPRARTFFPFSKIWNDRHTCHVRQTKRIPGSFILDKGRGGSDAHLGKIAIDHSLVQLRVRHVHDRVRLE